MNHEVDACECVECSAPAGAIVCFAGEPAVQWSALALVVAMLAVLIARVAMRGGKRGGGHGRSGRSRGGDGSCIEIYVGNLSYDMTEAQLRREFEKYGTVKSARIIENRYNKKSKGFGFVEMPVRPEAEAAINALHDKDIMGRKMRVNEAKNKSRE